MIGFYDYTVLATYAATALGVTGMFQAVEGRHLTAVFCLLAALYVTPLRIPKPGLAAICLLSAVGALELAGLILAALGRL